MFIRNWFIRHCAKAPHIIMSMLYHRTWNKLKLLTLRSIFLSQPPRSPATEFRQLPSKTPTDRIPHEHTQPAKRILPPLPNLRFSSLPSITRLPVFSAARLARFFPSFVLLLYLLCFFLPYPGSAAPTVLVRSVLICCLLAPPLCLFFADGASQRRSRAIHGHVGWGPGKERQIRWQEVMVMRRHEIDEGCGQGLEERCAGGRLLKGVVGRSFWRLNISLLTSQFWR